MNRVIGVFIAAALTLVAAPVAAAAEYGPLSHAGLRRVGGAPDDLRLNLQLGLRYDARGVHEAVRAAASPGSPGYGGYPSLHALAKRYGAPLKARRAVARVFQPYGNAAKVDATHQRMTVTISLATARRIFGTSWALYRLGPGDLVALPESHPRLPRGLADHVDIVAGLRREVFTASASASASSGGGSPVRTGTVAPSCLDTAYPGVAAGSAGLFPNQLLTAYGIAPLRASGLEGQGARVAIVGEAPTPIADVRAFRHCFGLGGTPLKIHHGRGIPPILESSLDAMVVSMVAPRLERFDLWVHPLEENAADQGVLGFLGMLAAPVQAAASGGGLPDVISVSYGECEADVAPFTAERRLVERQLASSAALGITVVIASGDSGASSCARDAPRSALTAAEKRPSASWPATSPYVLAVGGTNLTLDANNAIVDSGPWNDTRFPAPFHRMAAGGGGRSRLFARPWWQPAGPIGSSHRMVPDVSAFADVSPGYPVVCSRAVVDCPVFGPRQKLTFVGGTSASTPLVAGMVALWTQAARQRGLPRPGFVAPLLYSLAARNPQAFYDVTSGTISIFGGPCCEAGPGYDLATGLGSPLADQIAALLSS